MRVYLQPAYVLHARPFRNTSLLLEVLTADHGRIGLVARGVRSERSRQRGMLQPFRPLLMSWSGRGELGTLTHVEEARVLAVLTGRRLLAGFYVNELVVRLMHRQDPHPKLFLSYDRAVCALSAGGDDEAVLRVFEKRLLEALGYGLVLEREPDTGAPVDAEVMYRYRLEHGPLREPAGAVGAEVAVQGSTLLALGRESLAGEQQLREAKALMRAVLSWYLGDKPLQSRALFRGP